MSRSAFALFAVLLLSGAARAQYPDYAQIAAAPSAYASKNPLVFTMRFEGLKDVDPTFAVLGRNSSAWAQVIEPGIGRLPLFASMRSGMVRRLRELPSGVTYRFSGRLRYFKRAQYDENSFKNVSLNLQKQTKNCDAYYKLGATGPEASGHSVHYVLDLSGAQKLSASEQAKLGGTDLPQLPAGYQAIDPSKLAQLKPPAIPTESRGPGKPDVPVAGIPIRLTLPYLGAAGPLDPQGGLAQSLAPPTESIVSETDIERDADALQVLKLPGPLANVAVIAFGKDWDLAKDLEGMREGDLMVVSGVLKQAPKGMDAPLVLYLEHVEKASAPAGGPPGPPRPPGPPGPPR